MGNLANNYFNVGRHDDAVKLLEETLALQKATLGPDHPSTLISMQNLAVVRGELGQNSEAIKVLEQVLVLGKEKLGKDHPDNLNCMFNLAKTYRAVGRRADGLKLMEQTLALRADKLGPHHPETLYCMNEVAWYLANDQGLTAHHRRRAVELAKKAVEFAPKNGSYWNTLGVAQYRAGDWQAAVDSLERSIQLHNGGDSTDFFYLAMAEWQLDRKDEARNWYERAAQWMEKHSTSGGELRDEAAELLGITEPKPESASVQPAEPPAKADTPTTTSQPTTDD